jgi:L-iditol 2-dehydrogenase
MCAGRLVAPGRIEVGEFAIPVPAAGEVLVRMRRASICGSDVHVVYDGFAPEVLPARPGFPGHEGVGEVVESRSAAFATGDRVLTVPVPAQAACFAQYQVVPEASLVRLPPGGDTARLLMAQQLGTTMFALRRFWPPLAGEAGVATLIGAGSAGLFFLQQLRRARFGRVVVADREPARLEIARGLGADLCVRAPEESVVEATMDLTGGLGADLVVEAAGYDACRAQAVGAVRQGGRIGLFGFPEARGDAPFPIEVAFRKSASIEFSVGAQVEPGLRSFREAVASIESGDVEVGYCLAPSFPIERLPEAMRTAQERGRGAVKLSIELG